MSKNLIAASVITVMMSIPGFAFANSNNPSSADPARTGTGSVSDSTTDSSRSSRNLPDGSATRSFQGTTTDDCQYIDGQRICKNDDQRLRDQRSDSRDMDDRTTDTN